MPQPVVIVGASLAGLRTAESLRRLGWTDGILVVGDEPHAPYSRPMLSKEFLRSEIADDEVALPRRSSTADVAWLLGTRVVSADLDRREVATASGEVLGYGTLVVATGLRPRRLAVPGAGLPGTYALRGLDDAVRLRTALRGTPRVVVVGAGFVGCEIAAAARTLGCDVTVVMRDGLPLRRVLGQELAAELMRRHVGHGVRFAAHTEVVAVRGGPHVTGVELRDGPVIPCDVVVGAVGSLPNVEWLAGNDAVADDGLLTDTGMHVQRADGTRWDDVLAVGDVARFPNPRFGGAPARVEHWNTVAETARRAATMVVARRRGADDLAAAEAERFAPIPSFWSDQLDAHLLAYGRLEVADRAEILEGDLAGDCVVGYYRDGALVGVCGLGDRRAIMRHRDAVGQELPLPTA